MVVQKILNQNNWSMNVANGKSEMGSRLYREQLITVGDLETFKQDLLHEIKNLLKQDVSEPAKKWLRSAEVKKMLRISAGTLQNLRINGSLSHTRIGRIIFYNSQDIEKLLEGHG
jgi:hypothetical protein